MAGSRAAAEDQNNTCGTVCRVVKAVKSAFTQTPEPYDKHDEKRPTTEQARSLGTKSKDAMKELGID